MFEINPIESKNSDPLTNIERTANYEGNETLLFLERLNNPDVKKKLVKSLTIEHIFDLDQRKIEHADLSIEKVMEWVEEKLDYRINKIFNLTNINFEERSQGGLGRINYEGEVCPFAVLPDTGEIFSKKQLSITEAHEKGHGIREFNEKSQVGIWIKGALDFSNVSISNNDLDKLKWHALDREQIQAVEQRMEDKKIAKQEAIEQIIKETVGSSDNSMIEEYLNYYGAPDEIVERMSQLKNYFGMSGNEKLTIEHLNYARKNYSTDTGFALPMKPFFDAITSNTEEKFLDVINNLGV